VEPDLKARWSPTSPPGRQQAAERWRRLGERGWAWAERFHAAPGITGKRRAVQRPDGSEVVREHGGDVVGRRSGRVDGQRPQVQATLREVQFVTTDTVTYPARKDAKTNRQASKPVAGGEKKTDPVTDQAQLQSTLVQMGVPGEAAASLSSSDGVLSQFVSSLVK